ncbi:hypothetical protein ACFS5J_05105 [Flavobacterium chuncheonense]|uniref:Phage abortive infection protein n=1 Tax=Flavobacterium chuncheonense TaxID=2026653 RepID=A0ABW5YJY7_9FLAO
MNKSSLTIPLISKILIAFIVLCLISTLIPLFLFIYYFRDQSISNNIADWGTFGDFFGGMLNILISLISLIVLGYLTYLVGKQSIEENERMNIWLRKLDAYDSLANHAPGLKKFIYEISRLHKRMTALTLRGISENELENIKNEICQKYDYFVDFYDFLHSFSLRYSHLFNYDFDCEEFNRIILNGQYLDDYFKKSRESIEHSKNYVFDFDQNISNLFFKDLDNFYDKLKEELKQTKSNKKSLP